nr:hypothetical protein CFP56_40604 [Quercus suber]
MKPSRGRPTDDSCWQKEKLGMECAIATEEINADLNSDRSDISVSTPISQSHNHDINYDKVNPIITEHTSRDFDLHGDILHKDATKGATLNSMGCKHPSGPTSKSPTNKTPVVKLGLVSDTTAKWVRITRPNNSCKDDANNAHLGKRYSEAFSSELSAAKRRTQSDEVLQSRSFPTVEAV